LVFGVATKTNAQPNKTSWLLLPPDSQQNEGG
jgi:hypothetical protein